MVKPEAGTPVEATKFDRGAKMPKGLQGRIDEWRNDPPKSQFQMYGPIGAWLYHRFPTTGFLVKPQKLLRREAVPEMPELNGDGQVADQDVEEPEAVDEDSGDEIDQAQEDAAPDSETEADDDSEELLEWEAEPNPPGANEVLHEDDGYDSDASYDSNGQ
ncbi:hypothetical protein DFP72DRAFT_1065118 [Ephemerocybe angulata]|uniref:Uncharacterized protein n=1 Tax=Ephemerocybe angulata TaxID=980116 RepID=A0A8H6I2Z2_9AGAR|nr:hypothetical protein DFP72DRAFT_1065118 [Tulosesus angulatus]